jgi:hypothetical protein
MHIVVLLTRQAHNELVVSAMESAAKRIGATLIVDPFSNPLKVRVNYN